MADKDTRSPEEKGIDAARQRHAGESYARSHYGADRRAWKVSDALDTFAARVTVADFAAKSGRNLNGTRADGASKGKGKGKANGASVAPSPASDVIPSPAV